MKSIALTMASALALAFAVAGTGVQAQAADDASGGAADGAAAPAPAPDAGATAAAAPAGTDSANTKANADNVDAPDVGFVPDTKAVKFEDGRWVNAEDIPTFKIEDGKVDYPTYAGYLRYNSMCHVCHGPDGEGSTFAPAIKNSVAHKLDYYQFQQIVASGLQDVSESSNLVMPAFGTDRNVWCYIDDIYVYLLARGTGALDRGRPAAHDPKSPEFAAIEDSCMS